MAGLGVITARKIISQAGQTVAIPPVWRLRQIKAFPSESA
jgi:hypothetical protein